MKADNGGVDVRNGPVISDSRHLDVDPGLRIRIHIAVKRWIRTQIRIEVMWIRNP
jgi:hypothetical protein